MVPAQRLKQPSKTKHHEIVVSRDIPKVEVLKIITVSKVCSLTSKRTTENRTLQAIKKKCESMTKNLVA